MACEQTRGEPTAGSADKLRVDQPSTLLHFRRIRGRVTGLWQTNLEEGLAHRVDLFNQARQWSMLWRVRYAVYDQCFHPT